jgi:hypothetical protein
MGTDSRQLPVPSRCPSRLAQGGTGTLPDFRHFTSAYQRLKDPVSEFLDSCSRAAKNRLNGSAFEPI